MNRRAPWPLSSACSTMRAYFTSARLSSVQMMSDAAPAVHAPEAVRTHWQPEGSVVWSCRRQHAFQQLCSAAVQQESVSCRVRGSSWWCRHHCAPMKFSGVRSSDSSAKMPANVYNGDVPASRSIRSVVAL